MRIGVIGINHKSADLRLREKLARACQRRFGSERSAHILSYVLLSTCNRTEVYFSSNDLAETHTYLLNVLRQDVEEEFEHRVYSYFGNDCFFHLARVTAGMDSAIVGETEIQGQVKQAYESASDFCKLARELHFIFQKCLKIGKDVRSSTDLTRGLPTLEEAILQAGSNLLGNLEERRILFVGLSEINRKIFMRFKERGFHQITLCNRSMERASAVSKKESIHILPWANLHRWIDFDLAIFGTKCPNFLVQGDLKTDTKKLVIDLSVPRNVDPRIGRHPQLTLLNVDQLNKVIDRRRRTKAAEIARIETHIIAKAVDRQVRIFRLKELHRSQVFLSQVS